MKSKTIFIAITSLLVVIALVFQSCKKDEPANQNPTGTITSPTHGQQITIGETVAISVNATDSDGSITEVSFFVDNASKATVTSPPFVYNWNTNTESAGSHAIKATVTDNNGGSDSDEISVELLEAGGWSKGTYTDPRDGKTYGTITNGEQSWFSGNLDFDTTGSMRARGSNASGRYYTWQSARSACPAGWHLPSDDEWKALEMELFMLQSQADGIGWRGTVQGWWLKSKEGWTSFGNGTDRIGFTALPDGYMSMDGEIIIEKDTSAVFWTATPHGSVEAAWYRQLRYTADRIRRSSTFTDARFSVRCVKNDERKPE